MTHHAIREIYLEYYKKKALPTPKMGIDRAFLYLLASKIHKVTNKLK